LQDHGYTVIEAESGERAMEEALKHLPDMVILDIMMKGIDGFQVCKWLRSKYPGIGILLLSAKNEDIDKVIGLELGADDYMVKPFNPLELLARVKSILRRQELMRVKKQTSIQQLKSGPIELDLERMRCSKNGTFIELTPKEFLIVKILMQHPDRPFSREQLLDMAWGPEFFGDHKIVDVNIRRLREKIEDNPSQPALILTVWGHGYRWSGANDDEYGIPERYQ
jgi:DNA-binding response OmpR family regulator